MTHDESASRLTALIGSENGLVKRVTITRPNPGSSSVTVSPENVNKLETPEPGGRKGLEIVGVSSKNPDQYLLGRRDGTVLTYGVKPGVLLEDGESKVRDPKDPKSDMARICSFGNQGFAAFSSCRVVSLEDPGTVLIDAVREPKSEASLRCARVDRKTGRMALAGRRFEVQVWDLVSCEQPYFHAKKQGVKSMLDVPVRTAVNDVDFSPAGPEIATGSDDGFVRIYDPRAQRKPVQELKALADGNEEVPITVLRFFKGPQSLLIGTSTGRLRSFDIRKNLKMVSNFQGIVGSVKDVAVFRDGLDGHKDEFFDSGSKGVVATVGLGRWLCLHDVDSAKLLDKTYLKSALTCVEVF